jgi:hypothetical protein
VLLVVVLVGWTTVVGAKLYFGTWASDPSTAYAFSSRLEDVRTVVRASHDTQNCEFIYGPGEQQWSIATTQLFGRFSGDVDCRYPSIAPNINNASSMNTNAGQSPNSSTSATTCRYPVINQPSSLAPNCSNKINTHAVRGADTGASKATNAQDQNKTVFISANAWNILSIDQQTQLLNYDHFPIVNYRSDNTLEYWVFHL